VETEKVAGPVTRPRVALLATGLNLGGAETQLTRLATWLVRQECPVRVISLLPAGYFGPVLEQHGVDVHSLGMRRGKANARAFFSASRALRAWRPLILCSFAYHANLLGRLVGRMARIPVIISSIRNERFGGRWRDLVMRLTDPLSDATVVNCRAVANALAARGVTPASRLVVIPNAIDILDAGDAGMNPAPDRAVVGVGASDFVWISVGRLEEQKDYPSLLRAFARVCAEPRKAHLLIVGAGDPVPLQRLTMTLGISGSCQFLGERHDVRGLLRMADAFVIASAWEGLPNSVMEALLAGRPVVGTRVGGIPELVLDGVHGFLVPARQSEALAHAMLRLMQLPSARRDAMGAEGRSFVIREYPLERVACQWLDLFNRLLFRWPGDPK